MARFEAIFNETVNEFTAEFNEGVQSFPVQMDHVIKVIPDVYDGDYYVTPIVENDIVLPTKSKTMIEDFTVGKIPIYEMDNDKGGTTVYIATEVE